MKFEMKLSGQKRELFNVSASSGILDIAADFAKAVLKETAKVGSDSDKSKLTKVKVQ